MSLRMMFLLFDADYRAKSWIARESFSPYYVQLELYRVEIPGIVFGMV